MARKEEGMRSVDGPLSTTKHRKGQEMGVLTEEERNEDNSHARLTEN